MTCCIIAAMKSGNKPVRKCHKCLLNIDRYCWIYQDPREQWHSHGICPGYENEELYDCYRHWLDESRVKSRREVRQDVFRKKRVEPHWNHFYGRR